jgi:hypothetical protein
MSTALALPDSAELAKLDEYGDALVKRGVLPTGMSGAAAKAIIATGAELGIPPMTALRTMHFIDGKLSLDTQLQLSLALKAGVRVVSIDHKEDDKTGDPLSCAVTLARGDFQYTARWTMRDAERAGFLVMVTVAAPGQPKPIQQVKKDNWRKYPKVMLQWRAVGDALRVVAPDVVSGLYDPVELENTEEEAPQPKKGPWSKISKQDELKNVTESSAAVPQASVASPVPPPVENAAEVKKAAEAKPNPSAAPVVSAAPAQAGPPSPAPEAAKAREMTKTDAAAMTVHSQAAPVPPMSPKDEKALRAKLSATLVEWMFRKAGNAGELPKNPEGKSTWQIPPDLMETMVQTWVDPVLGGKAKRPPSGVPVTRGIPPDRLTELIANIEANTGILKVGIAEAAK